jgi:hypothetical protein
MDAEGTSHDVLMSLTQAAARSAKAAVAAELADLRRVILNHKP